MSAVEHNVHVTTESHGGKGPLGRVWESTKDLARAFGEIGTKAINLPIDVLNLGKNVLDLSTSIIRGTRTALAYILTIGGLVVTSPNSAHGHDAHGHTDAHAHITKDAHGTHAVVDTHKKDAHGHAPAAHH